ncbi:MAG: class D sortase [Candidatus Solibacter sp.]
MRPLVRVAAVNGILKWSRRLLLSVGLLLLGYCAFVMLDSWAFQRSELREFNRVVSVGPPVVLRESAPPVADALIGRIEVPRIGLSAMVVEGTTTLALRRAAGHIASTGMPGVPGNVGIAAHRDTFFRPLRNIRMNDVITLTTVEAEYRYRVVSTKVVEPGDVSVLDSSGDEILTLVTCYPFFFVGSAPDRFIVRAARII